MDATTIRQAKINQFDKHVEILEEQYTDKEIDVPKGKFQQPKPFTKNSGGASGTVYRHR